MKIHSPSPSVSRQMQNGRHAFRSLALCSFLALGVTACTNASAQSGLFDSLTRSPATQVESQGSVQNGLFTHGNDNYRVVNTAAFWTAADIGETEPGSIAAVGYDNSCSCGNSYGGRCNGFCGSSYGSAVRRPPGPCAPCEPFCYVSLEAVFLDRADNNKFTASPDFRMNDFDFQAAPRLTIGTVPDCVHGFEMNFTGQFEWDRGRAVTDPNGNLGTLLRPSDSVISDNLSAFSNATAQSQRITSRLWSIDINSASVGWEISKVLFGLRYIRYDERFTYLSQNINNEKGSLRGAADNHLWGPQVGIDLLYPICANGYTDFRARGGLFVNFKEFGLVVINDGSTVAAIFNRDENLAGAVELGGGLRYQLGDMLSVRTRGELWYLSRIDNNRSRNIGRRVTSEKDNVLILGISFGAELKY